MTKYKKLLLAIGLAGISCAACFWACKGLGQQPQKGFAVVELFTSEGCSSCPPADALVAAVQKEDKDLPVYVLAYHVDYWDRLGWKDAFSEAAYSDRQRQYASWLKLSSVYTPQIVVNGRTEFVGSQAGSLSNAIHRGLGQQATTGLSLSGLKVEGKKLDWQCGIGGAGTAGRKGHFSLSVALVQRSAVTQVKAGENEGKTLSHVQIVRSFQTAPLDDKGKSAGQLDWPSGVDPANAEIIAFLQDEATGNIVAATRAAVPQ
jgi:hypothetical protein